MWILTWKRQLGEYLSNFVLVMVNLYQIVLEKKWTDFKSQPNDFMKVWTGTWTRRGKLQDIDRRMH